MKHSAGVVLICIRLSFRADPGFIVPAAYLFWRSLLLRKYKITNIKFMKSLARVGLESNIH